MEKKHCNNCRKVCWHNKTANDKLYGGLRCTNCGVPVPTHNMNGALGDMKRAYARAKQPF